jgi:hypothetical protein
MERFRAFGARHALDHLQAWKRACLWSAMIFSWPVSTAGDALQIVFTQPRGLAWRWRTFWLLYSAALLRNVPPNQYVKYDLLAAAEDDSLVDYLFGMDLRALDIINRRRGASNDDVQDKLRFAKICAQHHLQCVPTLLAFRGGQCVEVAGSLENVDGGVFVKALSGRRGEGAEVWRRHGDHFVSGEGPALSPHALLNALRVRECIVQPLLVDCPSLRQLGTHALSCLRIVTARSGDGKVRLISAVLSLATRSGEVTSHHGPMYAVGVQSGSISGPSSDVRPNEGNSDGQNVGLVGQPLPHWASAVEMVQRAHGEAFPAFVTLGWDVALTETGPIIIEANHGWGLAPHQTLDRPLGKTALGQMVDQLMVERPLG